jgi:hypothetical protein
MKKTEMIENSRKEAQDSVGCCIAILISTSKNPCSFLLWLILSLQQIRNKGKIVSAGY